MQKIELNGEEPVWLTPYLRDPQPEGESERVRISYMPTIMSTDNKSHLKA